MNGNDELDLLKTSLRRPLGREERQRFQSFLVTRPADEQERLEEDLGLNDLLRGLPEAPISSNFTARVMQAVELERRAQERELALKGRRSWLSHLKYFWAPAAFTAAIALSAGLFWHQHQREEASRADLAESVAAVSSAATIPNLEWLKDFEAIERLNQAVPEADLELLAALQ